MPPPCVSTVAAVLAAAAIAGCAASSPQQPEREIGVVAPTEHLDPTLGSSPGTTLVARYVFQSLPQLAARVAASADGRTWTFELARGGRFTDGTPIDAAAVAANVKRWSAAAANARGLASLPIATAPDAAHAVLTFHRNVRDLVAVLADPYFVIGSPAAFADAEAFDYKPVGSGRYRVEHFDRGWDVALVPALAAPALPNVFIRRVPDPHTALLSLQKGDLDAVYGFPAQYLGEARERSVESQLEKSTGLWCGFALGSRPEDRVCPP